MWATLAITAVLSTAPAQPGQFRITNERATYGYLGPIRKEDRLLPGDFYFVTFDIEGLKVSDIGEVYYKMGMVLRNAQGKEQFKQEPLEQKALVSLGGNRLPAFAHAQIGSDTPPGEYTLEVTVYDPAAKQEAVLKRKFTVGDKRFGIIRARLSYDPAGELSAPPVAVVGQNLWVNFSTIGFQRDKNEQPRLLVEMRILDDKGKPTLPKPLSGEAGKDLPKNIPWVPMQFLLALNRGGRYTVQLKATDLLSKTTVEQSFDVVVSEPSK